MKVRNTCELWSQPEFQDTPTLDEDPDTRDPRAVTLDEGWGSQGLRPSGEIKGVAAHHSLFLGPRISLAGKRWAAGNQKSELSGLQGLKP